MTTSLLSRQIEDYTERYTTPPTPVLAELNRQTNLKRGDAVMISGHIQGAFLQMIAHMVRPMQVLEIGTFTGYSAICLAQGLQDGVAVLGFEAGVVRHGAKVRVGMMTARRD